MFIFLVNSLFKNNKIPLVYPIPAK